MGAQFSLRPATLPRIKRVCVAALLLGGCASLKNTPIQDYVWDMGRACEHVSAGWKLDRVDSAGRYWIRGEGPAGIGLFHGCMQEQYKQHPFNAWLKAQKSNPAAAEAGRQREVAAPSPVRTTPESSAAAVVAPIATWKPGNQWTYSYDNPRGGGVFALIVNREEVLDGTPFYVVMSGSSREIYYRKSDFAHYMEKVNGEVEMRNVPPFRLVSGVAGEKWEQRYTFETPKQQSRREIVRTCESSGPETITVPAGVFDAVKTTCVDGRTAEIVYEFWYSATVKQTVRERRQTPDGWRERELVGMRLYPDRLQ